MVPDIIPQPVMLIPGAVFQHESQVIEVGRNVGRIDSIEVLDLIAYLVSGFADGRGDVVGDFLLFLCMEAKGEEKKEEQ